MQKSQVMFNLMKSDNGGQIHRDQMKLVNKLYNKKLYKIYFV